MMYEELINNLRERSYTEWNPIAKLMIEAADAIEEQQSTKSHPQMLCLVKTMSVYAEH